MIVEVNYNANRLRIIFQTDMESTALRREHNFLKIALEEQISTRFTSRLGQLPNTCGEIVFSGDEFLGIRREIPMTCMAAYLMVENVVPRIPILDFLSQHFFAPSTAEDQFTTHSKSMEVTIRSLVDPKAEAVWANID